MRKNTRERAERRIRESADGVRRRLAGTTERLGERLGASGRAQPARQRSGRSGR